MWREGVLAAVVLSGSSLFATGSSGATVENAWAALDRGLQSGNFEHRLQAVTALSTIPGSDAEAVRRLEQLLKRDKDGRVRQHAAWALGQMKAESAIPALRAALDDSGEVAFAAAKSLIEMGDTAGRDMLVAVIAGQRTASPGIMTNVVREAQHRIKHPEGMVLMGAESAAGSMFGPAGMGMTAVEQTAQLRTKGAPARAAAATYLAKDPEPYAVTLLEWALQDDSRMVRMEAAKGLGQRGTAASIAKLEPLLHDDHNAVRTMAAASIVRLSATSAQESRDGTPSNSAAAR